VSDELLEEGGGDEFDHLQSAPNEQLAVERLLDNHLLDPAGNEFKKERGGGSRDW
jgi:hypothetical protein